MEDARRTRRMIIGYGFALLPEITIVLLLTEERPFSLVQFLVFLVIAALPIWTIAWIQLRRARAWPFRRT